MVFKLLELIDITKTAMEMVEELGMTPKQVQGLDIMLEEVKPDGSVHFSLRQSNPVIPEYHKR